MNVLELIKKKKYYEDLLWEIEGAYNHLKSNENMIDSNDLITINLIKALEKSINMAISNINEINTKFQETKI